MNIKALELQAKALAPIISKHVSDAVSALRDEVKAQDKSAELMAEIDSLKSQMISQEQVVEQAKELIAAYDTENKIYVEQQIKDIPVPEVEPLDYEEIAKNLQIPEDDLRRVVDEVVKAAVSDIPAPENGVDGRDGESVSIDDMKLALDDRFSTWALDYERQAHDVVQKSIDRMPKPKDGTDGVGFDDFTVEDDGIGNVRLKFDNGQRQKEFSIRLPVILDCGIFKDGENYTKGNGVTLGGSFYIAQVDSPEGRPGTSNDWRLAVKKGRDAPRSSK